ncbi:hypothetical protein ACJIZ3_024265 [Penstemon smallii]|uniref:Uncharacterized protein n=1 Tax=Penstemon smallii TaxID=265156 RepID=A0ABD3TRC0_9LAMI
MENGPMTLGLEDATIDVERLLVEPQDGHVSMDSVICFNQKIPENTIHMKEVSRSFGGPDNAFAQERKDVIDGDVLNAMHNEDDVGYFRMQSDLCSMGEEYLLGVEFAESITNLDYGSNERLHTSVSDCPLLAPSCGHDTPWKSDIFRLMEVPGCQSEQHNVSRSALATEKPLNSPTSCTLQNIGKFHDISSCSFEEVLSDENDGSLSTSTDVLCSPKIEKNDEFGSTGKDSEVNRSQGQDGLATISSQGSCLNVLPMQKRSRKPTQRYIDELSDPIPRYPKKRREVSSTTPKDKSIAVKDHKKCHMGSKAVKLPAEESSVKAIQVPFASLVHKECLKSQPYDAVQSTDGGNLMTKPKDKSCSPENQKKRDECYTPFQPKKRDDGVTSACLKKRNERHTATSQKKRDDCIIAQSPKKRDDRVITPLSQKKKDDISTLAEKKKRDDYLTEEESPEEISGRRKHHRLWTIAEVRKLVDGVSQYGVGRWSRIKKLFFSSSAHRTSVDLKDKWRNLLKASGILERGNRQGGKKRNPAWRPLPKSILHRVCELANMYPYPKGRKPKITHINHDSPDRSADITLNDYRRILRSING